MHPGIAVAGGMAERHAARRVLRLHRLAEGEKLVRGLRELLEAGLHHRGLAIVDDVAVVGDRDADPLVAALAVGDGRRHPAAVFLAEIVGDVAEVDAFRREQMRQRIQAPEHVRALTGIGGNGGLRLHVVERLVGDVHLDAGRLGEVGDQLHEGVLLGLDEALPAQQRELGILLRLPRRGLGPGAGPFGQPRAGQRAGRGQCGTPLHEGAAGERGHGCFLRCNVIRRDVFRSARRTGARAADRA